VNKGPGLCFLKLLIGIINSAVCQAETVTGDHSIYRIIGFLTMTNALQYTSEVSITTTKSFYGTGISGQYNKHLMIINDDARVIRMMLQAVASPTIIILTTLDVSFMLL
jgi:hypothetical protein